MKTNRSLLLQSNALKHAKHACEHLQTTAICIEALMHNTLDKLKPKLSIPATLYHDILREN